MKKLPDGTTVLPWEYDEKLAEWKERQKYEEKIDERRLQDERIKIEHEFQQKRAEQDISNRYFIALATLSAASITLLVQFISDSIQEFGVWGKLGLKFALLFFGVTLISCVLHNFINSKEEFVVSKKDKVELTIVSFVAVFCYVLGVGILITTIMSTF